MLFKSVHTIAIDVMLIASTFDKDMSQFCNMESCLDIQLKQHMNTWKSFAIGLMKSRVKGEDLLSEVLLKIIDNQRIKATELACEEKLFWYVNKALWRGARNETSSFAIKYTRYARNWSDTSTKHEEEREPSWNGSRLDNEYLDAYIQLMPQIDAIVLRLYMLDDFSYQKVSDETGIPIRDLYKLVERAINKIKRNVESKCTKVSPRWKDDNL
jgi:DNA-directed RNA polymerase specialized sigma24 family protein